MQSLNRWLLEVQSIFNSQGTIDPIDVEQLPALIIQSAANAAAILVLQGQVAVLQAQVALNTANIATNTANIATNTADIAALAVRVTALEARNQILNGIGAPGAGTGNNGDLYLNNTGGAGTRLYGKIAGAWIVIA